MTPEITVLLVTLTMFFSRCIRDASFCCEIDAPHICLQQRVAVTFLTTLDACCPYYRFYQSNKKIQLSPTTTIILVTLITFFSRCKRDTSVERPTRHTCAFVCHILCVCVCVCDADVANVITIINNDDF